MDKNPKHPLKKKKRLVQRSIRSIHTNSIVYGNTCLCRLYMAGVFLLPLGFACGDTVLTAAVLAIVLTAPLGAFAIDFSYHKLLLHED